MWIVIVIIVVLLLVYFTSQEAKTEKARNYVRSLSYEDRCQLFRKEIREWIHVYIRETIIASKMTGAHAEYLCALDAVFPAKEAVKIASYKLYNEYYLNAEVMQKIGDEEIAYAVLYYRHRVESLTSNNK